MMTELDAADLEFLASLLPEGAVATEFVAVVEFIDADGEPRFKAWSPTDSPLHITVGLLEVAKAKFVRSFADRWRESDEDDD